MVLPDLKGQYQKGMLGNKYSYKRSLKSGSRLEVIINGVLYTTYPKYITNPHASKFNIKGVRIMLDYLIDKGRDSPFHYRSCTLLLWHGWATEVSQPAEAG